MSHYVLHINEYAYKLIGIQFAYLYSTKSKLPFDSNLTFPALTMRKQELIY